MRADETDAVYSSSDAAVRRAWRRVLDARSLRGNLTLAEAGCDSLGLLQFVLVLERKLNRSIPLDIIGVEMRPSEIADALRHREVPIPPNDTRPVVFLMPGLDDDELRLAVFRVALRPDIRFILIEYPDWPEMTRPQWGFTDMVNAVVRQVLARRTGAPLLLTGYSFGGEMAFAAASRLVALGHEVHWLGILDTDITHVPQPLTEGLVARLRRHAAEIDGDVWHDRMHKSVGLLLAKLARQGGGLKYAHRTARWWRALLPLRTQFWFDRRTRSILRMRALWARPNAGAPGTLESPVTLFRSQAGRASSPQDLGWRFRCPALSIVQVPGDHHTLFDPPHREVLCTRYAEVVQMVTAGHPGVDRRDQPLR